MHTEAIMIAKPGEIGLERLALTERGEDDLLVETLFSGVSSGTERLLFEGLMPPFPGLSYPLIPGYETVGKVVEAESATGFRPGDLVFVPGASCIEGAASLFGASASKLVVTADRAIRLPHHLERDGILLALAATAHHAIAGNSGNPPELIIGHGVLGRLVARLTLALGYPAPTVWERDPRRREASAGYSVMDADSDPRADFGVVMDVSGDASVLDLAIPRLRPGGEIVLAGFYPGSLQFEFAPAFMREIRMRIAAEFKPDDCKAVLNLIESEALDLSGLISHRCPASRIAQHYPDAFTDKDCLKMAVDWRH